MLLRIVGLGLALASGCGGSSEVAGAGSSTSGDDSTTTGAMESSSSSGDMPAFCAGAVELRYDPQGGSIDAFPDDALTEAASTTTGLRIRDLGGELADDEPLTGFPSLLEGLATLDGFGTTAPAFLRVRGAIDPESLPAPGTETDPEQSALLLVDLDADPPRFLEFEWRLVDEAGSEDGTTLLVDPLRPLREGTRHGLVLTGAARASDGDCIAPSATMQDMLATAGSLTDVLALLQSNGAIEGPTDLSAAVVFTTQTSLGESTEIASAIAEALPPPATPLGCSSDPYQPFRVCEVVLKMADFTDAGGVVSDGSAPQQFYDVPVTTFLPREGVAPFPTVIYGHALTGDRSNASWFAYWFASAGYAVVAIDAPKHGAHPDVAVGNAAIDLLGLTGDETDPFLALYARDNFRQAAYDKLQLLRAIEVGLSVDANDDPDFDVSRLHYLGVSLGAVMAPQFLAYAPQVRSAVLTVGGARLTEIVQGAELSALVFLATESLNKADRVRVLAVVQSVLDGGEPQAFAQHVLADRIDGFDGQPQLLAQMSVGDTIVPNSSTAFLARALGLAILGPAPVPIRGVEVEPELPVAGNFADGRTAGLYEFVEAYGPTDMLEPATHYNVQSDPSATAQVRDFILSAEDPAGATVNDPRGR